MSALEKVPVETKCPVCESETTFYLDRVKVKRWKAGELVQRVFPELTGQEREMLTTGYCGPCWEEVFNG